jgi:hypothetical protein
MPTSELTESEKNLKELRKLSDNSFLETLNRNELEYLYSMVDPQDAMYSVASGKYIEKLEEELKKRPIYV